VRALAGAALALAAAATPAAAFDGYVLALSWSPTFCATPAGDRERLQCDAAADHTFIVHGLWPNDDARELSRCRSSERPSRADIDAILDIMPSPGLANHEWRTHGTCTGLSPDEYFRTVREAYERVTVPPGLATLAADAEVRPRVLLRAFQEANPGLEADGIALRCDGDRLEEVRVCLTPDLDFTTCRAGRAESCNVRLVEVPAPE
jgi:ribonuclease T2